MGRFGNHIWVLESNGIVILFERINFAITKIDTFSMKFRWSMMFIHTSFMIFWGSISILIHPNWFIFGKHMTSKNFKAFVFWIWRINCQTYYRMCIIFIITGRRLSLRACTNTQSAFRLYSTHYLPATKILFRILKIKFAVFFLIPCLFSILQDFNIKL